VKLPIERVVTDDPKPEELPRYGFEQPSATLAVDVEGGPRLEVVFGSGTSDNAEQVYAKRSDEASIYALSRSKIDELLPELSALRAKACFAADATQATKVELQWPDNAWTIEQQEGQWKTAGGADALDQPHVTTLLAGIKDLTVSRFFQDQTASEQNGLAPAQGILRIWTTSSPNPEQLEIGHPIDQSTGRYGRIEGRPGLVELPPEVLGIAQTSLASLKPAPATTPAPPAPTPTQPTQ
jgi:hypothetical protein